MAITVGFLGWYALPAFINLFTLGTPYRKILPVAIDAETTIWTVFYLSSFMVAWLIACGFFSRFRFFPVLPFGFWKETDPRALAWMGIVFCVVGLAPYVVSGLSLSEIVALILRGRLAEKPWIYTENLGNYRSALLYVSHSAMAAGACVLWLTSQQRSFPLLQRVSVALIALFFTLLIFFDQGTRSIIALVTLPVLLTVFLEANRRSALGFVLTFFILGAAFLVFIQFQLLFRGSSNLPGISALAFSKWITLQDTTDLFSETVFAVKIVPSLHDFFRESVILQFLASPVPRFLWPSKPATEVVWFYTLQRWGIDIYEGGGNVFPGIVGQSYMSWGAFGPVLVGGFIGWLSSRVDGYMARTDRVRHPYFWAVGLIMSVWLLLSFRVLSTGFLYPVIMVVVLVALASARKLVPVPPSLGN